MVPHGQHGGVDAAVGKVNVEIQRVMQRVIVQGLEFRLGGIGQLLQGGVADGEDLIQLRLFRLLLGLLCGIQQIGVIILGAGADVGGTPVPVVFAYGVVALRK